MYQRLSTLACAVAALASAAGQTTESLPALRITGRSNWVEISFSGILQAAASVTGPWMDLTNAVSPHADWLDGTHKFYRARGPLSIFSKTSVVHLTITGPLQEHFEKALAGLPDGIFPPVREKPYFDGRIELAGLNRPISLRVRGNSSLQECPFPKLKFKISREQRAGTPFFDAREVKIGTHCAEGGRGPIGRLRDQTAAYREALVYEVMQTLGLTSPRVRRARIEYHDTTPTNGVSEVGWVLARNAFIMDDIEVVAERLGGRALDDEEVEALRDARNANFDELTVANLLFLHVFLGNWDYALSLDGSNLWNTDVIELPDKRLMPVAGDFDLCSFVTGEVHVNAPWDYHPELPDLDREARFQLETVQKSTAADIFASAAARFEEKRAAVEQLVSTAELDEPGRTNAVAHVNAFYGALTVLRSAAPKP